MSKSYPYFRWFVADAETDELYASMNDTELGFYHRLLNRAWQNCGLPSDLDELAATMRVKRSYVDKLWPKVGKCFVLTETVKPRLINPRQEKERDYAISKSERATDSVRTRYGRRTDELPRASGSDSVSSSGSEIKNGTPKKSVIAEMPTVSPPSVIFETWWIVWSSVKGTNHRMQAESAYFRKVTAANEADCLECTRSYLDSLDNPAKGFNPENFIEDQARDHFRARWPAKARDSPAGKPRQSTAEAMLDRAAEILREEERRGEIR